MGTAVIRSGIDAYVRSDHPNRNYRFTPRLSLSGGTDTMNAYMHKPVPVPRGATVLSAKLRIAQVGEFPNTTTVYVRRVTEWWGVGKVDWNNRPATDAASEVSVQKATSQHAEWWEFDVTAHVQQIVDGDRNFGWRFTTGSAAIRQFTSMNSGVRKPVLEIEWSDAPDAPTTLSPADSVISTGKPKLRFDYTDVSGSTELNAVQVQIDPTDSWSAPQFDSGTVLTSVPELDLAATTYPGLAAAATTYWRVRVQDAAGLWSKWSDSVAMTNVAKGVVTITSPAAEPNNIVAEYTPPIVWTFTGTQIHYGVLILDAANPSTVLHNSGKTYSTTQQSYTVPPGVLKDQRDYIVKVRIWDDQQREAVPGEAPFSMAQRTFHVEHSATPAPSGGLAVVDAPIPGPWADLTWTRDTTPDSWTILRDGQVLIAELDPADTLITGTQYQWRDWTVKPGASHTYEVLPVVNGEAAAGGPTITHTATRGGMWLADPDSELVVALAGDDPGDMEYGEEAATLFPLGRPTPVRIVQSMRGLEGTVAAQLVDAYGITLADLEDRIFHMKSLPEGIYRFAFGNLNIPVVLGKVSPRPMPTSADVFGVSFEFWQVGELPFEVA